MEQKKFMDIKRIVQENEMHKNKNTWAFEPGDHIVIQIKIDGSNASVRYDPETGKLAAFSRKQQIVRTKDVDATSKFLDYVDTLDAEKFQKYPDYVFFGEWMTRHRVPYPEKYLNIWIMYDVYDLKADGYLPQKQVKALAAEVGVPYIHVLYDGPFVDWDHCRSFMRITKYTDGDCEEGIIVKADLDEKIMDNLFFFRISASDCNEHDTLFYLKSLDLDRRMGYELGTIYECTHEN